MTARNEEQAIQDRCPNAGIKLLPKSLVNYVKVVSSIDRGEGSSSGPSSSDSGLRSAGMVGDIILIDDDKLVLLNWAFHCKKNSLPFHGFDSIEAFLASSAIFDKASRIYIDSNLGDGYKGEVESERILSLIDI